MFKNQKVVILSPVFAAILLFVFNSVFLNLKLYHKFWWLDVLMHFLGGAIAASFFAAVFRGRIASLPLPAVFIFIVGSAAIIGIFWELFEWFIDNHFINNFMGNLQDTISDLGMDLLGGLITAAVVSIFRKKESAQPLREPVLGEGKK